MARIKFGSLVTEGSGSLGGHTIQNSKGGPQWRTKPLPIGNPSAAQRRIRSFNPILQWGWRDLSEANRKIWNDFAPPGLSGHSIWMSFNFERVEAGLPFLDSPYNRNPYPSILDDGNTVAWYQHDKLNTITKDGADRVSRWNDYLGSGHDLIQATGANQPLWSEANGVLFDGVTELMKAIGFVYNQPEQIYIVLRQISWTLNDTLIDGNTINTGRLYQSLITPELRLWAGAPSLVNNNLAINTFGIIRNLFNGAASTFQINETPQFTGNYGANNMSGFTLGANGGSTGLSNIEGKEALLRNVADTAPNNQAIYNYLTNKHSI